MLYYRAIIITLFLTIVQAFGVEDRIAFSRLGESGNQIYTMNMDGSNLTQVTRPVVIGIAYYQPTWSPDGKQLAVTRRTDTGDPPSGICLLNLEAPSEPSLLVPGLTSSPRWSPDGKRIVFSFDNEIEIIDVDGSNQVTVVHEAYGPAWSPDGRRIAYSTWQYISGQGAQGDIWISNADGTHPIQITTDPVLASTPDWSPNGKKILFLGRAEETNDDQIYVVDIESGTLTKLTNNLSLIETPSWSPTGTRIVYIQRGDIWVMEADGSNEVQLTRNPIGVVDSSPDWWGSGVSTVIQSLSWGQVKTLQ